VFFLCDVQVAGYDSRTHVMAVCFGQCVGKQMILGWKFGLQERRGGQARKEFPIKFAGCCGRFVFVTPSGYYTLSF
jgi:hypothetical protein